ncbi:MAG: hypothetical protein ACRCY9_00110 [Phycicoccus sp.]
MNRFLRALGWSATDAQLLDAGPDPPAGRHATTTPEGDRTPVTAVFTTTTDDPVATITSPVITGTAITTTPVTVIPSPHHPLDPPGHHTEGTHIMADYESILDAVQSEVTGFIGASIVDLDTGMSLASRTTVANFDLDVASAYNSEMVKGKFKTMQALGLNSELEDMLLTLSDQLHLIKVLDHGKTFIYVAAVKATTNLALLRRAVNENTVGR